MEQPRPFREVSTRHVVFWSGQVRICRSYARSSRAVLLAESRYCRRAVALLRFWSFRCLSSVLDALSIVSSCSSQTFWSQTLCPRAPGPDRSPRTSRQASFGRLRASLGSWPICRARRRPATNARPAGRPHDRGRTTSDATEATGSGSANRRTKHQLMEEHPRCSSIVSSFCLRCSSIVSY